MWATGPADSLGGPSTATAFATASHGRITFPADQGMVVTLNADYNFSLYNGPSEEAPGRTCCDTGQMAKTARIELNKTGIDLDAFDHKIYAWPVNPHLHSPLIHLTRGR